MFYTFTASTANRTAVSLYTFSVAGRGYNHWQVTTDTAAWASYNIQVADAAVLPAGDFLSAVYLGADLSVPAHQAEQNGYSVF